MAWGASTSFRDKLGVEIDELGNAIPYINVGTGIGIDTVACGISHVCMKLDNGAMKCLGFNTRGQIGIGVSTNPIGEAKGFIGDNLPNANIGSGLQVLDLALGSFYTCALVTGNKVKCYGDNYVGQLGQGDSLDRGSSSSDLGNSLAFIELGTDVEVASIHAQANSYHTCVVLSKPVGSEQRIKCWGSNSSYQLGYGTMFADNRGDATGEMGDFLPLVDFGTESRVRQLALGEIHTCALLMDNNMKCFGDASFGQLASGSTVGITSTGDAMPSVIIDPGKTIKFVSTGLYYSCIIYDDQTTLKCFGDNLCGQLGQGDTLQRGNSLTTVIPNISAIDLGTGSLKIISLHSGWNNNCLIYENNSVKCFGINDNGQLAIGSDEWKGDQSYEMGSNLSFALLFAPSQAPTMNPTLNPTKSPIPPSKTPTKLPTTSPTQFCNYPSAKLCKYDVKCKWAKVAGIKQCILFDCTTLNKGKCNKEKKMCKWKKNQKQCITKKK